MRAHGLGFRTTSSSVKSCCLPPALPPQDLCWPAGRRHCVGHPPCDDLGCGSAQDGVCAACAGARQGAKGVQLAGGRRAAVCSAEVCPAAIVHTSLQHVGTLNPPASSSPYPSHHAQVQLVVLQDHNEFNLLVRGCRGLRGHCESSTACTHT